MDQRFLEDSELRLSGEQRLKLEIIRSLREPCDRKTYGQKLKEAAQKLGKSERTVRRLVKAWQENGLAAFAETPRADKGQTRKSEYWYELTIKIYKAGNRYTGSSVKNRPEDAEEKACISLPELEKLIVGYIVDHYNQKPDARSQANPLTPKQSRIERWEKGLRMPPTLLKERELDICLMKAAERVVYDNGYLNFSGLRYRGENLGAYAGEKVILRFDPRDITLVLVYGRKNNKEIFLARAYAVGLEAERLSIE